MLDAFEQDIGRAPLWNKFRPAAELACHEFLESAEWPERERFRRRLVQRKLTDLSLDEMLQDMPRSPWERQMVVPDRVVLSLQALQELPQAGPLLDTCMAIVRRAYELYSSEIEEQPELRSDDPVLLSAAKNDAHLLLCAREVLNQHWPNPLGGGTAGTASTEWARLLNESAMPFFGDVVTVDDYLAAQERIIGGDRVLYGKVPPLTTVIQSSAGIRPRQVKTPAAPGPTGDFFVIMPFTESWSDGTYAFIRRAFERLSISVKQGRLYRADEIAAPGQISDQIKEAIETAQVVIADITGVNPNVMWELGYADGQNKAIVILNQNTASSPFDVRDRRQVVYHLSPTPADEESLVRHLKEAWALPVT
jgi:hypothetical protein